jgi:hypothetical protein
VAEFAAIEASVPNEDQQAIIDCLVDADTKGLHVICGGPGTGKTYVTQWIAHKHRAEGKSLVLSASTGAAATRLSKHALTNHVAYVLPVNGPARAVPFSDPLRAAVHMKATFILDEFSMTTSGQLDTILQRLQTLGGYSTVPAMLQEIKVVLVGDEKQVRHTLMNVPLPWLPGQDAMHFVCAGSSGQPAAYLAACAGCTASCLHACMPVIVHQHASRSMHACMVVQPAAQPVALQGVARA